MESEKIVTERSFEENFIPMHLRDFLSDDVLQESDKFVQQIFFKQVPAIFTKLATSLISQDSFEIEGKYFRFKYDNKDRKVLLSTVFEIYNNRIENLHTHYFVNVQSLELIYHVDEWRDQSIILEQEVLVNLAVTLALFFENDTESVLNLSKGLLGLLPSEFWTSSLINFENALYLSYGVSVG